MPTKRFLPIALLAATLCAHAQTTNKVEFIPMQEIIEAALTGKIDTVEKALKRGFQIDTRDPENRTILMYAAFNGHAPIVKK
ncbi:MAG: ankyrin repeat domain-containing protein, partial [Kiritimatiellaceae bacterium]|nr:ankyrin repeat domain-containing protein [Kiritimatiellaceae bacterium]